MRYTARARMISFDFLVDDIVYHLPLKQVILLTGMIIRADNLGRLPGEPDVLLPYLFYPKSPRSDMSIDDVRELVMKLAGLRSPMIAWYTAKGSRYIQFLKWWSHQSLPAHNKRSSFPGPDDEGSVACMVPKNETQPLPFDEPQTPAPAPNLSAMVSEIAKQHARQWDAPTFDANRIAEWCGARKLANVTEWVKLGGWLWSTGVTNNDAIAALIEECERLKPENPYAYFAAGNNAREAIVSRFHGDQQVKQHEQEKRATEAFLGKAGR